MRVPRTALMLLALSAFQTACDASTAGMAPDVSRSLSRAPAAPVHRLTGGGKIDLSAFDLFPETYAFSASRDASGNVRGQAEIRLSDPRVSFHSEITCLAVSANSAWVGGIVTTTSDPGILPEETQWWLRVQDNAGSAEPDKISFVRLGALAAVCNEMRPVSLPFNLTIGNFNVH